MTGAALWIRGLIFSVVVPGTIAVYVPGVMSRGLALRGGLWNAGWLLVVTGAAIYAACLLKFLFSGGTPAIFFTRALRFAIGEEPNALVFDGLYRLTRNPMYVGVTMVVFGQAVLFGSRQIAAYGVFLWLFFHIVVVLLEEPYEDPRARATSTVARPAVVGS
jgi:protein-S-isoprenylcysteine O-methyltransferase Ste14